MQQVFVGLCLHRPEMIPLISEAMRRKELVAILTWGDRYSTPTNHLEDSCVISYGNLQFFAILKG
jgi:hypothetical protein